ncbi:hypothetical protein [Rhizobium leguminosarum]|nr:hypothetical protein [Rhizobium leguminosarum]
MERPGTGSAAKRDGDYKIKLLARMSDDAVYAHAGRDRYPGFHP